jgi:signal transduction histidine kinase
MNPDSTQTAPNRTPPAEPAATRDLKPRETQPFSLSKWFAIVGLISITLIGLVAALLLTRFLTDQMLRQEAVLTMEFVQSVVMGDASIFVRPSGEDRRKVEGVFERLSNMPDVLRTNIYSTDRILIWSSDESLIGKYFPDNDELEESLRGELVVHDEDTADPSIVVKAEHQNLDRSINYFVEIYLPIWDRERSRVIAVAELYKRPRALFEAIQIGKLWIWTSATIGGLFLYFALFSMIRRADNVIRNQQDRLVESETLAAVGEMGTAVAHGIRNPLTAIRSSAELALEGDPELAREGARDIIAEVDRLEQWVRDLLSYSRPVSGKFERIAVGPLLQQCLENFLREMEKRRIRGGSDIPPDLPPIRADSKLLAQVVNSLIANAMEAMEHDGSITVSASVEAAQKTVVLTVHDTGPGMSRAHLERVFKPFYTTKPKGLGVGLPLAKRIVERFGGQLVIDSAVGQGTTVKLTFAAAV